MPEALCAEGLWNAWPLRGSPVPDTPVADDLPEFVER